MTRHRLVVNAFNHIHLLLAVPPLPVRGGLAVLFWNDGQMKCRYRCMECGFAWANYQVKFHRCAAPDPENVDPETGNPFRYMGQCPDG